MSLVHPHSNLLTNEVLRRMIDHTLLKPEALESEIEKLCDEALRYQFFSVCLHSTWIDLARQLLSSDSKAAKESKTKICTVVGFPLGTESTEIKARETEAALKAGADEIDMVIAIHALKNQNHNLVFDEIKTLATLTRGKVLKVILETALLSEDEKVRAAEIAQAAGADFVKTSTGFAKSGATVADIRLLRKVISPEMGLKASGGIRTRAEAEAMVAAGATRLGVSRSVEIILDGPIQSPASDLKETY